MDSDDELFFLTQDLQFCSSPSSLELSPNISELSNLTVSSPSPHKSTYSVSDDILTDDDLCMSELEECISKGKCSRICIQFLDETGNKVSDTRYS